MPPSQDIFAHIGHWVESSDAISFAPSGRQPEPGSRHCTSADRMTLCELRNLAIDTAPDDPSHAAVWRHLIHRAQGEQEDGREHRWTLIVLWLLAPRLGKAAYTIARRTGAEVEDVRGAQLVGALQALRSATAAQPGVEQVILRAAYDMGWRTGRRDLRMTLMEEGDMVKRAPLPGGAHKAEHRTAGSQAIQVDRLSMALAQRAHGERLGALAHRLDLMAHIRKIRHNRRKQTKQRPTRSPANGQRALFDEGGLPDASLPR